MHYSEVSMILSLLICFASLSGVAFGETQEMVYDLILSGDSVGRRRVTVRYLPGKAGEVRVIESYTELSVPLGKRSFGFVQRLSGMGAPGAAGFVATTREMGKPYEVQLTERLDGWRVSLTENQRLAHWNLEKGAFDATSLTLVDPEAATEVLSDRSTLRVLSAETGKVVEGKLVALGAGSVAVAGTSVPVSRWAWELPSGRVELAYGPEGHLVAYNLLVGGKVVQARLQQVPEARSFGDNLDTPIMGPGIEATEL